MEPYVEQRKHLLNAAVTAFALVGAGCHDGEPRLLQVRAYLDVSGSRPEGSCLGLAGEVAAHLGKRTIELDIKAYSPADSTEAVPLFGLKSTAPKSLRAGSASEWRLGLPARVLARCEESLAGWRRGGSPLVNGIRRVAEMAGCGEESCQAVLLVLSDLREAGPGSDPTMVARLAGATSRRLDPGQASEPLPSIAPLVVAPGVLVSVCDLSPANGASDEQSVEDRRQAWAPFFGDVPLRPFCETYVRPEVGK